MKYKKYVMTDYASFQEKDLKRLRCLRVTSDLFNMFFTQADPLLIMLSHVIMP